MADVPVTFTGDPAKVLAALANLEARAAAMNQREEQNAQKAGQRHREEQGQVDKTTGALGRMAAGVVSVAAAWRLVNDAARDAIQIQDEAASRLSAGAGAMGRLAIEAKTPAEYQALIQAVRDEMGAGGAKTREEAAAFVAELKTAGALGERAAISRIGVLGDPTKMVATAQKIREAFGGAETGNLQAILSKAIAAGGQIPGSSPEELLLNMAPSAVLARERGMSDEELFAAVSLLGQTQKSTKTAGSMMTALLSGAARLGLPAEGGVAGIVEAISGLRRTPEQVVGELGAPGLENRAVRELIGKYQKEGGSPEEVLQALRGAGYAERIGVIEARPLSQQEFITRVGSEETYRAWAALKGMDIRGRVAEVTAAEAAGLAGQRAAMALGVDLVAGPRERQAAAGQLEVSREPLGVAALGYQAERDRMRRRQEEAGQPLAGYLRGWMGDLIRLVSTSEATKAVRGPVESLGGFPGSYGNYLGNPAAVAAIEELNGNVRQVVRNTTPNPAATPAPDR